MRSMSLFLLCLLWSLVEVQSQTLPYISFREHYLPDHSYVDISEVGDDRSGIDSDTLQCHTDLETCCRNSHYGDWFAPGSNTRLPFVGEGDGIYESRLAQVVHLSRRNNANGPSGIYRCVIPTTAVNDDNDGSIGETVYVGLYASGGGDITISGGMMFTVDSDLNGASPQFTLTCISTGGPATIVIWTRDSVTVTEGTQTVLNDGITSQYTHTLTVTGILGGLYTCTVANNKPSEDSAELTLGPSPPSGVAVSQNGAGSIQVSWTPPSGEPAVTGYIIYYRQQDGGHTDSVMAGATSTTANITGLITGATYFITMVATSNTLPSTVTDAEKISLDGVVLSSDVEASPTSLTFSWKLVWGLTAISAYNISYFNTNTQCFTDSNDTIGITAPPNTHSLTGLQEGTQYSITVTVIVSDGGYATDSITATTMDTAPAAAPASVNGSGLTTTSITVWWGAVDCINQNGNITGYLVQYALQSHEGNTTVEMANGDSSGGVHNISGLLLGTAYIVQVAAVNSAGTGVYSDPITIETLQNVFVRFGPTFYTSTETKGRVTVWIHVDEGVNKSFTVALIPGKGFEKSTDHYRLDCNVRLGFNSSIRSLSHTYDITRDETCDYQFGRDPQEGVNLFKVDLVLVSSTDPLVAIDFDNSEATVFIDDSMEEECITIVGYEESRYILFEETGYLEVCVVVTRNGSQIPFVINVHTTKGTADSPEFIQSVENLIFFNGISNMITKQCYNLTIIGDTYCEYYHKCTNAYLLSQLTTESNTVKLNNNVVPIYIEEDLTQCEKNRDCTLPSEQSTAAVAIPVTVVIVLLAVVIILGIMFYFYFKKKKVKSTDITQDLIVDTTSENQYSLVQPKESPLLQQLRTQLKDKRMIVSKDQLHLTKTVGQGESGLVYRGYIDTSLGSELVAVKTAKALFSSGDLERLTKEISTMLSFEHPNVMSLVGVCLDGEIPLLIMPFMSKGNILEYIRDHKQELLLTSEATDEEVQAATKTYLNMCHQITKGMTYLAKEKFVHRDLAARNCMIDGHGVIKVADFGLTEDMYGTNYFRRRKSVKGSEEKVPIRWMAPESIENDIYNESTDVWSFGVTVWELFTCGRVPYSGIPVMSVLKELKAGQRLEKPENTACSNEIYDLMTSCWDLDSHQRPKFANLQCDVSELLEAVAGYMELCSPLSEMTDPQVLVL